MRKPLVFRRTCDSCQEEYIVDLETHSSHCKVCLKKWDEINPKIDKTSDNEEVRNLIIKTFPNKKVILC